MVVVVCVVGGVGGGVCKRGGIGGGGWLVVKSEEGLTGDIGYSFLFYILRIFEYGKV